MGLADRGVEVPRGTNFKGGFMPVLLDLALGVMVLAGALFLGSVAVAIFKEVSKKDDNNNTPSK